MLVDGNEVFDLKPKLGIFAACLSEKRWSLLRRAVQRGIEEFLYLTPTVMLHGDSAPIIVLYGHGSRGFSGEYSVVGPAAGAANLCEGLLPNLFWGWR